MTDRLLSVTVDETEPELVASLGSLSLLVDAERAYVFLFDEEETAIARAFEWCAAGVVGHDFSAVVGAPVASFPWTMDQLRRDAAVDVPDASRLPAEAEPERQACAALGIGAYVNLPLWLRGKLIGWLGFDADRAHPGWTDEHRVLMQAAGRMLTLTIDRLDRERALRQERMLARKLAAVGSVVAGIGHEINNPLAYLKLNLQHLQRRLVGRGATDEETRQLLQENLDAVVRIEETLGALRAFASVDEQVTVVDLGDVLRDTVRVLATTLSMRAQLEIDVEAGLFVKASSVSLGQVFANLLQNSLAAIPEARVSENSIRVEARRSDDEAILTVADSGPGFAPEVLPHVFEPFFTTRGSEGGTGIGLALCYSLVTQLGGRITADNAPEGGAVVTLMLPISAEKPELAASLRPAATASTLGRKPRILLVDDLAPMRRALRRVLARDFEVEEASDGTAAIERLRQDGSWDVVLCDMIMPNGNGRDVYTFVEAERPELLPRLVFISGGVDEPGIAAFLARVPNRRLPKPVDGDRLLEVFAEVLAATGPRGPAQSSAS